MYKNLLRILGITCLIVGGIIITTETLARPKFVKTGKTLKQDDYITLQVRNQTLNPVSVEIPSYTDQMTMQPKERRKLRFKLRNKEHGLSVLYWSPTGEQALSGKVNKPNSQTVLLDLRPGSFAQQDDRAIYDTEIPGTILVF
ncbi:hypothetical protein NIES2119_04055 [[Phormidium ambiguum] IAM M-71]|uniref:Uncharacterized protein n=1 Tax=[Phormidium ambiguum] IAM M-71 TaxID=454136 RepID=A0A1U7IRT2_9CYAN|nr:hypothetical protein [Phormidium ambiguum]OKH40105.1 hypothetical protein NIES2119_04055 [Phormidium ambiguum IAM M-71]